MTVKGYVALVAVLVAADFIVQRLVQVSEEMNHES